MNKMIKKASEEYFKEKYKAKKFKAYHKRYYAIQQIIKEKYKAKKFKAYHKRYYAIQQIIIKLKNLYGL